MRFKPKEHKNVDMNNAKEMRAYFLVNVVRHLDPHNQAMLCKDIMDRLSDAPRMVAMDAYAAERFMKKSLSTKSHKSLQYKLGFKDGFERLIKYFTTRI